MEHRYVKCPNENLTLTPQIWNQGACTNVEPQNPVIIGHKIALTVVILPTVLVDMHQCKWSGHG